MLKDLHSKVMPVKSHLLHGLKRKWRKSLNGLQIIVQWFQQQSKSGQRVAFMLPLYYLQRSRIAEALHAYTALKDNFAGGPGKCAVTPRMVDAECNVQWVPAWSGPCIILLGLWFGL